MDNISKISVCLVLLIYLSISLLYVLCSLDENTTIFCAKEQM